MFGEELRLIGELDFYYAIFLTIFTSWVLFESFNKRGLSILAWLTVICHVFIIMTQSYKLFDSPVDLTLFSAIFKTCLIMLFFALALSWVKELTENVIPSSDFIFLELAKQKSGERFEHLVTIRGLIGHGDQSFTLTPTLFDLLHRFVQKRKDADGWMEIKPKSEPRPDKIYDIKDHNEIKRLTSALLDGLFGKGLWDKTKHEEPLKASLFEMSEKRERKIRLAIPVENLSENS